MRNAEQYLASAEIARSSASTARREAQLSFWVSVTKRSRLCLQHSYVHGCETVESTFDSCASDLQPGPTFHLL